MKDVPYQGAVHQGYPAAPFASKIPPPHLLGKAEVWNAHDLMTYIVTATPLAYVLPLCFRRIQHNLKQHAVRADADGCQVKSILSCIPPANPDMQAHSELDWYFDYDLKLPEFMTLPWAQIQSRMVTPPGKKKNRYAAVGLRGTFAELLETFHTKIHRLKDLVSREPMFHALDACIWRKEFCFATNSQGKCSAWLGLGEPRVIPGDPNFRRPVCIREDPFDKAQSDLYKKFKSVMSFLNPSGYISAAIRSSVHAIEADSPSAGGSAGACVMRAADLTDALSAARLDGPGSGSPISPTKCSQCHQTLRPPPLFPHTPPLTRRWVYEVGICTLQELFSRPITAVEKQTQAFRSLLREGRAV